jgi:hypothetical protein
MVREGRGAVPAGKRKQRELAVRNYRKSLELDPTNENARAVLERLGP